MFSLHYYSKILKLTRDVVLEHLPGTHKAQQKQQDTHNSVRGYSVTENVLCVQYLLCFQNYIMH